MLSEESIAVMEDLPPFANKRNRDLDRKIKEKQAKIALLNSQLEDNTTRAEAMGAHMKNVQQEIVQTQALYDAKTREIETEDHFKQLADAEVTKYTAEVKDLEKNIAEMTQALGSVQSIIHRETEKLETFRKGLKMNKVELEEWLKVQQEKDEDQMALSKYSKEDSIRIKELTLQIEKLTVEINKKKATLSAEVTETQVAQLELNRTTEAFRKLHTERQELISMWEDAVKEMQKKDTDISEVQERYLAMKEKLRQKQNVINDKTAFLEQTNENNADTDKKIQLTERAVAKLRTEQQETSMTLSNFQDELAVLQNTVKKAASELQSRRKEVVNLRGDVVEKQDKLQKARKTNADSQMQLKHVTNETMTKEQKAQELQELLKKEEARSKEVERDLRTLKEQLFKRTQEVFKLRQEEKTISMQIDGTEATIRSMNSKIHQLDVEAEKQQALLYAQDFQIQQLERRVRRAQGERSEEEKEVLEAKIAQLTIQLDTENKKMHMLQSQMKKSQDDLRVAKRRMESLEKERSSVLAQIDDLNLYTEGAGTQLAGKIREKEELLVEENVLRLELRKLRGFLNARADEVFSLESRQLQLNLALEERTKEIEIHKEMLRLQLKQSHEERLSAAMEFKERVGKVDRMKKRYEILMMQLAPSSEDGEEHSQAYYVIKAAQEREAIQKEGDELDGKIRKTEREIKALENTLKLMNDRNEQYRSSLHQADLDSKDVQHKELLDQQYRAAMEKYKAKRQELQSLQEELAFMERTLSMLTETEAARMQNISVYEKKLQAIEREINDQDQKRDRAKRRLTKFIKELHSIRDLPMDAMSEEELDIHYRYLKDYANSILVRIAEIEDQRPEISTKLQQLFEEAGIQPVSRPASRSSSQQSGRGMVAGSAMHSRASSRSSSVTSSTRSLSRATPGTSEKRVNAVTVTFQMPSTPGPQNNRSAMSSRSSVRPKP